MGWTVLCTQRSHCNNTPGELPFGSSRTAGAKLGCERGQGEGVGAQPVPRSHAPAQQRYALGGSELRRKAGTAVRIQGGARGPFRLKAACPDDRGSLVEEALEKGVIHATSARGIDAPLLQGLVVEPRVLAWGPAPPGRLRARARPENHLCDEPARRHYCPDTVPKFKQPLVRPQGHRPQPQLQQEGAVAEMVAGQ
jgi:hypothetical protein